MTELFRPRLHRKAEILIELRRKNCPLLRGGRDGRREEESLEKLARHAERSAEFFSEARRREAIGCVLDVLTFSGNVTADRCKTASRVLDEGANHQVCAVFARLMALHEFAVAIVHHADDIRFHGFDKANQLRNLIDRECFPRGITLGALNFD